MSDMTPADVIVSFFRFANLPDSQRETYLRQHPEILNGALLDIQFRAAEMREPEFGRRVGSAALYIATKMNDRQRQTAARELIAKSQG